MPKQQSTRETLKACTMVALAGAVMAGAFALTVHFSNPSPSLCNTPGFCEVLMASVSSR